MDLDSYIIFHDFRDGFVENLYKEL